MKSSLHFQKAEKEWYLKHPRGYTEKLAIIKALEQEKSWPVRGPVAPAFAKASAGRQVVRATIFITMVKLYCGPVAQVVRAPDL